MFRIVSLALLALLTFSCAVRPGHAGIYYWKTVLDWSDKDTQRMAAAGVDQVGLRLFDWGVKGEEGPLLVRAPLPAAVSVVPIVYVTTAQLEAWARAPRLDSVVVASELLAKMQSTLSLAWSGVPRTWQLDADWAEGTRDSWFAVLAAFRDLVHIRGGRLEVTVRLHQVRDRATQGIPPVDGGVLMLYGAGDTVLDRNLVDAYLKGSPYPLPLVPALPAYTQVRQNNGYGRLVALHRLGAGSALPLGDLQRLGDDHYLVLRRSALGERPLLAHDELFVDRVDPAVLAAVAALPTVAKARRESGDRVWIFDYDSQGWEALIHGPLAPSLFPR